MTIYSWGEPIEIVRLATVTDHLDLCEPVNEIARARIADGCRVVYRFVDDPARRGISPCCLRIADVNYLRADDGLAEILGAIKGEPATPAPGFLVHWADGSSEDVDTMSDALSLVRRLFPDMLYLDAVDQPAAVVCWDGRYKSDRCHPCARIEQAPAKVKP